jgi:hypothetical protein
MLLAPQRVSAIYPMHPYGSTIHGAVAYRPSPLDVNWSDTWPIIRTILIGSMMLLSSAAIIGLDIANLVTVGNNNGILGGSTTKVGAGIWTGCISFVAGIFVTMISMKIFLKLK